MAGHYSYLLSALEISEITAPGWDRDDELNPKIGNPQIDIQYSVTRTSDTVLTLVMSPKIHTNGKRPFGTGQMQFSPSWLTSKAGNFIGDILDFNYTGNLTQNGQPVPGDTLTIAEGSGVVHFNIPKYSGE